MQILLIGPNGSGKTTQASLLAEYLKIPLVETGGILRDLAAGDSVLGLKVKGAMERGILVSDVIIAKIIKKRLLEEDTQNGFVATGFPRNLNQLNDLGINFDKVFYLEVSDDEVIKRLMSRGRADDTKEAIQERLNAYHSQTEPLLEHYEKEGKLMRIDGSLSVTEVFESVKRTLNNN